MNDDIIQKQDSITLKSKIINFYKNNKIIIFIFIIILLILVISTVYLAESNKSKRIALADNYIEAKVYLANNDKEKVNREWESKELGRFEADEATWQGKLNGVDMDFEMKDSENPPGMKWNGMK